ncbi:MAG: hypothetical protein OQL09_09280 [Gammaproteobacteria bacterium]|nr:hypothetical protein [Gammaproteobacteria bacterium]
MHLPHFNRFIASCPDALLLYVLVFAQLILLCQLLALKPITPVTVLFITGVPLLVALLYYAAARARSRSFHMSLLMVVFAHYGLLLGAMLDFGAQGLFILVGLCGSVSGLSAALLWELLSIAPWTVAGMLIGGNLGMLLSSCMSPWKPTSGMSNVIMYPVCNLGMLAGMVMMELQVPASVFATDAQTGVFLMLLLMLLSMSFGMLLSWWLVKGLSMLPVAQRIISHGVTP